MLQRPIESALDPAIRVMHQPGQVATSTFTLEDPHLQGIKRQLGMQRPRYLPTDDLAVEHVGDERDVDPPSERVHIGDVGDPQPVRSESGEVALYKIGRASLPRC